MKVKILKECGYEEAILGLSLSYNVKDLSKVERVAVKLSQKEGGHNKFLESIVLWIEIDAPRYWWSQFDTYRVGTTKQSGSTMHTLLSRELVKEDFEDVMCPQYIDTINRFIKIRDFEGAKAHLPESFLQKRIVCTNYKVIRNIISQRKNHRLKQWRYFIDSIYRQVHHYEFFPVLIKGDSYSIEKD